MSNRKETGADQVVLLRAERVHKKYRLFCACGWQSPLGGRHSNALLYAGHVPNCRLPSSDKGANDK